MNRAFAIAMTVIRVCIMLAMNAVVIAGFMNEGWSAGTVLALYWAQTVIGIPLTTALVVFHRRATRKSGHYGPFLTQFVLTATVFALGHALFLALMVGVVFRNSPGAFDRFDFEAGLSLLATMQLAGFAVDLTGLRSRPFAWVRHRTETIMQRVALTHMVIIIGMFAAAMSSNEAYAFFGVFIAFKLLADIVGELPAWDPVEPPRWGVWLARRFGNQKTDFPGEWRRMREERRLATAQAERTVDELAAERAQAEAAAARASPPRVSGRGASHRAR